MPVGGSSTSYYPSSSRSTYYRTTPSTSLLLNRTSSLDRSSYSYTPPSYGLGNYSSYSGGSSYSSGPSSAYSSRYSASKPPRPSYSSSYSSDSYRSRIRDSSPVRSSYTIRNSSESRDSEGRSSESRQDSSKSLGSRSISDTSSRYSASTVSSRLRDGSNSRDSGYGSRLTSRDRSVDIKNGNTIDTNAYGPTASSYASNYRWEGRNKNKEKIADQDIEEEKTTEKVRVSDRIRNFEPDDDIKTTSVDRTVDEEVVARRKKDEDNIAARRKRLGLSPIRSSRSRTPTDYRTKTSEERNGNDDEDQHESRKSVLELRRKYDTANHNGYTNSSKDDDDTNDEAYGSTTSTTYRETPTIRCESPTSYGTRRRTDSDNYNRESPTSTKTSDNYSSTKYDSNHTKDSTKESRSYINRLESPSLGRKKADSPQSRSPDGRKSPLTNGTSKSSLQHLDDPSCNVTSSYISRRDPDTSSSYIRRDPDTSSSYIRRDPDTSSSYSRRDPDISSSYIRKEPESSSYSSSYNSIYGRSPATRRDRVRERIAARLASELEDEDSPSAGQRVAHSVGGFSETSGLVGLRNIGNTCFLNSVTQCLSNTRCLVQYLVKEGYSGDINTSSLSTMKGDLIRAFGNLLSEMWTEGDINRALNTGPFKTQIQRFAPTFSGYQQHDAQEFLRKLLEGLHEDVNRVTLRPRPLQSDIDEDISDDQKAMESWKRYLRYDDSKIVDMFVGQLKSSLQCSYCSHTSVTFDPFWDLSLPIPNKSGTVKMNQCLDLFTKEEVMDGDERPTCSRCKERRKMTKSFNIQKFPKVLVLHLKRFSPTERWRGKLSCTVEFPLENLDLSRYASSTRSSCNYNLIGVANHSGTTYSGHYTAFCKHPYSGQWHEYNDSRVSQIAPRKVCSPEAYVCFYELTGSSKL